MRVSIRYHPVKSFAEIAYNKTGMNPNYIDPAVLVQSSVLVYFEHA
jgi:hypothetical protein